MVEKSLWHECVGTAVPKVYGWPTDLTEPEIVPSPYLWGMGEWSAVWYN